MQGITKVDDCMRITAKFKTGNEIKQAYDELVNPKNGIEVMQIKQEMEGNTMVITINCGFEDIPWVGQIKLMYGFSDMKERPPDESIDDEDKI